jgi:hypothetical protein
VARSPSRTPRRSSSRTKPITDSSPTLPDALADFTVEHFGARTSPLGGILIEPLHGYATRVPDDATAFANRHAAFNLTALSMWESPAVDDDEIAWARAFGDGVAPHSIRAAATSTT